MLVYMLMGMFVLPVFAPPSSLLKQETIHPILPWAGTDGLVGDISSGGYIAGSILGACLVGWPERGWDRRVRVSLAMVVGNLNIYVIGVPWLASFVAFSTIPGFGPHVPRRYHQQ